MNWLRLVKNQFCRVVALEKNDSPLKHITVVRKMRVQQTTNPAIRPALSNVDKEPDILHSSTYTKLMCENGNRNFERSSYETGF